MYILLIANATTHFNLSKWSFDIAALLRNFGANVHISHILYIDDRGSNILIGSEIWEIERPFNKFTANYFATCANTPFYFSNATKSEHISPPDSGNVNPYSISSFEVGRANF